MAISETSNLPRHDAAGARPTSVLDWVALVLMIVGSVNWGLVGLFPFDLVAALFGEMTLLSRIVYTLVGIAGVYGLVIAAKWARRS
jgi:uncharacterized membrane protein YuzA (DUF378 family)